MDVEPARVLVAGRYRILGRWPDVKSDDTPEQVSHLGIGMWRARDDVLGRSLLLAWLPAAGDETGAVSSEVLSLAQKASSVVDPRLARVLDAGRSSDGTYVAMLDAGAVPLTHVNPTTLTDERLRAFLGEAATGLQVAADAGLSNGRIGPATVACAPAGVQIFATGFAHALPADFFGATDRAGSDAEALLTLVGQLRGSFAAPTHTDPVLDDLLGAARAGSLTFEDIIAAVTPWEPESLLGILAATPPRVDISGHAVAPRLSAAADQDQGGSDSPLDRASVLDQPMLAPPPDPVTGVHTSGTGAAMATANAGPSRLRHPVAPAAATVPDPTPAARPQGSAIGRPTVPVSGPQMPRPLSQARRATRETISLAEQIRFNPTIPIVVLFVALTLLAVLWAGGRLTSGLGPIMAASRVAVPSSSATPSDDATTPSTPSETSSSPPAATPTLNNVALAVTGGLDPQHPETVMNLTDGDLGTAWSSMWFASPDFNGAEGAGVALTVSLREPAVVHTLVLVTASTGGTVEVRAPDPNNPAGGTVLASGSFAPTTTLDLSAAGPLTDFVIWIPTLPVDTEGHNRITIYEIQVS